MERIILLVAILLCYFIKLTYADIVATGDIDPTDPTAWTSSVDGYIGKTHSSTLEITNGDEVINKYGYIGYGSDSTGEVTVDGPGSKWHNKDDLTIGYNGSAILNITNSGTTINDKCYIGRNFGSTGVANVNGPGSDWLNLSKFYVGYNGSGELNITDGGIVNNHYSYVGYESGSTGVANVDGSGSWWGSINMLFVGHFGGSGTLSVTDGGEVTSGRGCYIGYYSDSIGVVTVDGPASRLSSEKAICIGRYASGVLNITNGGLTKVVETLSVESETSFINMSTGGMLALRGDADDSLDSFLDLIEGTDAIRFWDDSVLDWVDITSATYGKDYILDYITDGNLNGYTVLTVPEPCSMLLLGFGGLILRRKCKRG